MKAESIKPHNKERIKGQNTFAAFDSKNNYPSDLSRLFFDTWLLSDLYIEGVNQNDIDASVTCSSAHEFLSWCLGLLDLSPTAQELLNDAMNHGWSLGLEDLSGLNFHIDVPEKQIIIDSNGMAVNAIARSSYFRNSVLLAIIRALRDVWQEKRHGSGFEQSFGPEAILMLERVRAADCDVIAVLVAWQLRGEGYTELWRSLIGSEEGDMALAFSNHLERDPSSLFNGKALLKTFSQWYKNESRVNACDHDTLEYLDSLVLDHEAHQNFGERKLSSRTVEVLSCLPDKTAYLQGYGDEIITAPLYAGFSDPVNQSHFMHIVRDLKVKYVQGVPFRDSALADKIFPGGFFTAEEDLPIKPEE